MTDIAQLSVKVTTDGIQIANRELGKLGKAAGEAERKVSGFSKANKAVDNITRSFQGLGAALGALGLGAAVTSIVRATDTYASFQGQLALVTDSQDQLNATYDRALRLANQTGQATESTINLYARLARSTAEIGLNQDQLFTITEAVNQSFVVSGASASEASSSVLQLSQGLAAGALRGEELNSVMENSPRLSRALADGLGVSIGQLRQLGADGELTAEKVTAALLATAETINADFQKMPITVGRVVQRVQNTTADMFGKVDARPVMDAVKEFERVISDQGFKRSITTLTEAVLGLASGFASTLRAGTDFATWLGEEFARRIHGVATDDIPGMEAELARLEKRLDNGLWVWAATDERVAEVTARAEELRQSLDDANRTQAETSKAAKDVADAMEGLSEITVTAKRKTNDLAMSMKEVEEVGFKASKAVMSLADASQSVAQDNAEAEQALRRTREEVEGPFAQAMQETVGRIDGAFADAWRGAFDSFESFADGIKNALKNLLGELAHMALTRPIVMSLGASVGLGSSAASAAGGISGAGGLMSAIGGGLSSIGSPILKGVTGLEGFLANQGFGGAANMLYNAQGGFAQTGGLVGGGAAAGAALTGGAGLAGGFIANSLFGGGLGTSIGSSLGGIGGGLLGASSAGAGGLLSGLGAAAGPLGALAGAVLAGGLGSLIGNNQPSDKTGTALLDLSAGTTQVGGLSGKKFSQENRDAAEDLARYLEAFSDAIGGSSARLDIGVGSRDGLRLNGKDYGEDVDAFFDTAFDMILQQASSLQPAIQQMIMAFDGTGEEIVAFASSITGIATAIDVNVVDETVRLMRDANDTMMDAYHNQLGAIEALTLGFDGSLVGAQDLQAALAMNQQTAAALAQQVALASDQIGTLFETSANQIRESVLTEDQRVEKWKRERDQLREGLENISDPDLLINAAREINSLNMQVFRSLENAGTEQAEVFATYAEETDRIAQERLTEIMDEISSTQDEQNARIAEMLEGAAGTQQTAADTMYSAVRQFMTGQQTAIDRLNESVSSLQGSSERSAQESARAAKLLKDIRNVGTGIYAPGGAAV